MKKILFTLIVGCFSFLANSQECGTPTNISQNYTVSETSDYFDGATCINVAFHIVRQSNGTGGLNSTQIPNIVNMLNQYYNPHSINIINAGVDYVDNSTIFNIDDTSGNSTEFNQLVTYNNNPNAINFYIVNNAVAYKGRAGAITSRNLVVSIPYVLSATSPHELGHCLNLYHTFQGTLSGSGITCAENPNGTNCATCGDIVCDTPADSNSGNSGGYSPDMTNAMSYYSVRDHFTALQGLRMRNALNSAPTLTPVIAPLCSPEIVGPAKICATANYNYTFSNPNNIPVVWSTTPNLQIISWSNTGVTVKAINSTIVGYATIYATVNNLVIDKKIWVGRPNFTISRVPIQEESCDIKYHYIYFRVNNRQPGDSFTWTATPIPGMTHGWSTSDRYRFTIPKNFAGLLEFSVVANNSCGTWSIYQEWDIYSCTTMRTAMEEESPIKAFYKLYPNPADDIVNIDLQNSEITPEKDEMSGTLYDMMGYVRGNVKIIGNRATLYVGDLPKGIYILKIVSLGGHVESHRIAVE